MTADNALSRSLVIANAGTLPAALRPELEEAQDYARADKAAATRRAYKSDFEVVPLLVRKEMYIPPGPPPLSPQQPSWRPRPNAAQRHRLLDAGWQRSVMPTNLP